MKIKDEAVEAFTQYRRSQVAELRPWQPGDDMTSVSVSPEDTKAGSPKPGDMIARNPKNHADQWLVAAAYFADNFEPISALPHLSQGAVSAKQLEWKVSGLRMFVADTEIGQYAISRDPYSAGGYFNLWMAGADDDTSSEYPTLPEAEAAAQADYESRILSALSPAPVGVMDEGRGKIAYALTKRLVIDMPTARAAVDEALASHEPAPTEANDELERVDADANAMAWGAELKSAEARILELEADLEVTNDLIRKKNEALRNIRELNLTRPGADGLRWAHSDLIEQEIVFGLGGQSNG